MVIIAQTIRANLLATAMAATMSRRRSSSASIQPPPTRERAFGYKRRRRSDAMTPQHGNRFSFGKGVPGLKGVGRHSSAPNDRSAIVVETVGTNVSHIVLERYGLGMRAGNDQLPGFPNLTQAANWRA